MRLTVIQGPKGTGRTTIATSMVAFVERLSHLSATYLQQQVTRYSGVMRKGHTLYADYEEFLASQVGRASIAEKPPTAEQSEAAFLDLIVEAMQNAERIPQVKIANIFLVMQNGAIDALNVTARLSPKTVYVIKTSKLDF